MHFIELSSARFLHWTFLTKRSFYGFNIYVDGYERKLFPTFWAFSIVLMENLVWRFEFIPFIQHMAASLTGNTLRHKTTLQSVAKKVNIPRVFINC